MNTPPNLNRREFFRHLAGTGVVAGVLSLSDYHSLLSAAQPKIKLGVGTSLAGKRIFPKDNPWNQDISKEPVDPKSARMVGSIGVNRPVHPDFGNFYRGEPIGIPYVVVSGDQAKVNVTFRYRNESDAGPYPIPDDAPIEGGPKSKGDRHVIIIDRDNWKLYELYAVYPRANGWQAGSGAIFDLNSNELRQLGWTSADAAGLPIFPGMVRYDEVFEQKAILHALRFTCRRTRKAFIHPARHYASKSNNANFPPMGMRVRLKAGYDISKFPKPVQVILTALKKYGMFLADNGSDWFVSGTHDKRWDHDVLATLKQVKGKDLEVVKMGKLITRV